MIQDDVRKFMTGEADMGLEPASTPLSEDQRKLSAMGMAINAALVQFIIEGIVPYDQQVHFMGHLQDFANRLYRGESVKIEGTRQTLQINSQVGNLFFEATVDALEHGSENYAKLKEINRQYAAKQPAGDPNTNSEPVNDKPTVH